MTAALEGGEWSAALPGRTLPPGKDPVPMVQEGGWAPGPVWTGGKSRPTGIRFPDRPARSESLYRLSYPAQSLQRVGTDLRKRKLHALEAYENGTSEFIFRNFLPQSVIEQWY
jgi:hypothetical protein